MNIKTKIAARGYEIITRAVGFVKRQYDDGYLITADGAKVVLENNKSCFDQLLTCFVVAKNDKDAQLPLANAIINFVACQIAITDNKISGPEEMDAKHDDATFELVRKIMSTANYDFVMLLLNFAFGLIADYIMEQQENINNSAM